MFVRSFERETAQEENTEDGIKMLLVLLSLTDVFDEAIRSGHRRQQPIIIIIALR